jgi:mevalonate kinase
LGVSTDAIDDIVETTMQNEVHSKITGAGGGGCVLCLSKEKEIDQNLVYTLETKGYTVYKAI